MERILVGFDGSDEAREALRYASALAKQAGGKLILATAVYLPKAFGAPELEAQVVGWEEEEIERSSAALEELASGLRRRGMAIDTSVLTGPPAEALAEEARALDVDLVVVGHRGRGALRRILLGSVADRLVQICPRPVTVVVHAAPPPAPKKRRRPKLRVIEK